jgi:hypothetical protein
MKLLSLNQQHDIKAGVSLAKITAAFVAGFLCYEVYYELNCIPHTLYFISNPGRLIHSSVRNNVRYNLYTADYDHEKNRFV